MTPDSYDSSAGLEPVWTRVYRPGGRLAHLRGERIACETASPQDRYDPDTWLGTGSQAEYDRAASLPLCLRCFAAREAGGLDHRLGTGHGASLA